MLESYRDLIEELTAMPGELRRLLGEPAVSTLDPTVIRLVAELRDRDRLVLQRLQAIMAQREAYLRAIPAPDEHTAGPEAEDAEEVVSAFNMARGDLISLLMNLTLRDWDRAAMGEVDGETTLAEEVERHVEFDEEHLARIEASLEG
ncbi:MAG: hypothetical protein M3R06_10065 [Chloroflexota bacterium]|nr:hypothetical protein [Chloroflexota bacterium]